MDTAVITEHIGAITYLGYIALIVFAIMGTFIYTYHKTNKFRLSLLATVMVFKFIVLLAWIFGIDRVLFVIVIYNKRQPWRPPFIINVTANMLAFLSSLTFTVMYYFYPKIKPKLSQL